MMDQNSFFAPSIARPLLPALLPAPRPCPLPAPARACPKKYVCHKGGRQSMFLRRRARSIRMRIILILFWLLEVGVCTLCMFLLLRGKGVPANFQYRKVPTKFSSGIGLVNTMKYQPNTNQKYQIGIQLYFLLRTDSRYLGTYGLAFLARLGLQDKTQVSQEKSHTHLTRSRSKTKL